MSQERKGSKEILFEGLLFSLEREEERRKRRGTGEVGSLWVVFTGRPRSNASIVQKIVCIFLRIEEEI